MYNRRATTAPDDSTPYSLAKRECDCADPIDAAALARFRRECDLPGSPLSDQLLDLFTRELEPRVSAIRDAIKRGDATAVRHAAHALKGSSSLIGARPMAELCLQIELAGRSDAIAAAWPLLNHLEREAVRVRQALVAACRAGAHK